MRPQVARGRGNPYSSEYEMRLKKMVCSGVSFVDYVYGSDMDSLFKRAYLYVTASVLEGTSPALLSAMGFDAGMTFRTRNVEHLCEKMSRLLSNPEIVHEFKKKAMERVARFY